jgi:hypothetical protein
MKKPALFSAVLFCILFSCQPASEEQSDHDVMEEPAFQQEEDLTEASEVSFEEEEKSILPDTEPSSESLPQEEEPEIPAVSEVITNNNTGQETLFDRFDPPAGFQRMASPEGSYGYYLQHLPLKPEGSSVKYYDGALKPNRGVYAAVVDMEIGTRDLQQCADAIMRLRAEHLWHQQQYDQIHFNFTNGFRVDYEKWRQGHRIQFDGNRTSWVKKASPSNSYKNFRRYMDLIFAYAGTASLEKELKPADPDDLQIGDIFIQGGFPGHAVVVVDVALNTDNGQQVFLLAQSYMPAQDIQILQNPNDEDLSPWYNWPVSGALNTPEWRFDDALPKRF